MTNDEKVFGKNLASTLRHKYNCCRNDYVECLKCPTCFKDVDKFRGQKMFNSKNSCQIHQVNVSPNSYETKNINTYMWNIKVMCDLIKKLSECQVSYSNHYI